MKNEINVNLNRVHTSAPTIPSFDSTVYRTRENYCGLLVKLYAVNSSCGGKDTYIFRLTTSYIIIYIY